MNTKITSIARIIALLAIIGGLFFLIKDTMGGCYCHCSWIFWLLGLASALLFLLWVRDMIGSDNNVNAKDYSDFSGGKSSLKNQDANAHNHHASSAQLHDNGNNKVVESIVVENESAIDDKNVHVDESVVEEVASIKETGKVEKKELSEEEKSAKLNILQNVVGIANGLDDLKEIVGIGPVYEGKLHEMGIKTFEQLAKLTPEAIDAVEELTGFPGRVEREDWIGQAKKLMNG